MMGDLRDTKIFKQAEAIFLAQILKRAQHADLLTSVYVIHMYDRKGWVTTLKRFKRSEHHIADINLEKLKDFGQAA